MILWLDGDEMDSWDDLVEHLFMIGEANPCYDYWVYKGACCSKKQLIEILKPLVELNVQLYDAWGLLYEFKDLDVPHSMELFKEKVKAYLENPIGWRKKE